MAQEYNFHMNAVEAHAIKKDHFYVIKGHPVQVSETRVDKGKDHWHELHVMGVDILTNKKFDDKLPEKTTVHEFKPIHSQQALSDLTDHQVVVSNDKGGEDRLPYDPHSDLGKSLRHQFDIGKALQVTIVRAPVEKDNAFIPQAAFSNFHVRV